MSCIFQSHSGSQIAISAWNKSSRLSLFSPFHMNPHLLLPRCPLDTSPRSPVESLRFFLTCQMWLIRFPTSCAKAPKAGENPQCCAEGSACALLQLYTSVKSPLRCSWELGGSRPAPSCGCWAARPMGRLHLSDGSPHLYTTLQWHDYEKPTHFFPF